MPTHCVFADESARGQRYYVGAACVAQRDLKEVRRLARSFCVKGQRRWHFTKKKDSRRAQIMAAIVASGRVIGWVGVGKGNEVVVRARCLQQLGADVARWDAERLVIESREGRDEQDRRSLFPVLSGTPRVRYEHQTPGAEPGLWIADAIAWCYGAGGLWRQRVSPMIQVVRDVGQA